jgi:hypothetical protein
MVQLRDQLMQAFAVGCGQAVEQLAVVGDPLQRIDRRAQAFDRLGIGFDGRAGVHGILVLAADAAVNRPFCRISGCAARSGPDTSVRESDGRIAAGITSHINVININALGNIQAGVSKSFRAIARTQRGGLAAALRRRRRPYARE